MKSPCRDLVEERVRKQTSGWAAAVCKGSRVSVAEERTLLVQYSPTTLLDCKYLAPQGPNTSCPGNNRAKSLLKHPGTSSLWQGHLANALFAHVNLEQAEAEPPPPRQRLSRWRCAGDGIHPGAERLWALWRNKGESRSTSLHPQGTGSTWRPQRRGSSPGTGGAAALLAGLRGTGHRAGSGA